MQAARHIATLLLGLAVSGLSGPMAQAQERGGFSRGLIQACRMDAQVLCGNVGRGGGRVLRCLQAKADSLSTGCRAAMQGTVGNRSPRAASPATTPQVSKVLRDVSYRSSPRQKMDIYLPKNVTNAPVIFMVHGGGWRRGSKSSPPVVTNKVAYWLPKGYIFISIDNRLLPQADPLEQAQDVGRAIAAAQAKVSRLGGNPGKFVLMGHSAGAHLVALLSADPSIARRFGAAPWRGTVALDSAAYDVPAIMREKHPRLYDQAFGTDPAFWRKASPRYRLTGATRPMLLVCSSNRADSCAQANAFRSAGARADVLPIAKSHGQINADLGKPGAYTAAVDRFVRAMVK